MKTKKQNVPVAFVGTGEKCHALDLATMRTGCGMPLETAILGFPAPRTHYIWRGELRAPGHVDCKSCIRARRAGMNRACARSRAS